MLLIDKYQVLAEEYGLELILNQNDLTPEDVIRALHLNGLIDIDDYFYEDIEDASEED